MPAAVVYNAPLVRRVSTSLRTVTLDNPLIYLSDVSYWFLVKTWRSI